MLIVISSHPGSTYSHGGAVLTVLSSHAGLTYSHGGAVLTVLSSHAGLMYSRGGLLLDNGSICAPLRGYFPRSGLVLSFENSLRKLGCNVLSI